MSEKYTVEINVEINEQRTLTQTNQEVKRLEQSFDDTTYSVDEYNKAIEQSNYQNEQLIGTLGDYAETQSVADSATTSAGASVLWMTGKIAIFHVMWKRLAVTLIAAIPVLAAVAAGVIALGIAIRATSAFVKDTAEVQRQLARLEARGNSLERAFDSLGIAVGQALFPIKRFWESFKSGLSSINAVLWGMSKYVEEIDNVSDAHERLNLQFTDTMLLFDELKQDSKDELEIAQNTARGFDVRTKAGEKYFNIQRQIADEKLKDLEADRVLAGEIEDGIERDIRLAELKIQERNIYRELAEAGETYGDILSEIKRTKYQMSIEGESQAEIEMRNIQLEIDKKLELLEIEKERNEVMQAGFDLEMEDEEQTDEMDDPLFARILGNIDHLKAEAFKNWDEINANTWEKNQ